MKFFSALRWVTWGFILSLVWLTSVHLTPFRRVENALYDLLIAQRNQYFPLPHDPRIEVVSIEPSTYRAFPKHSVFWVPYYAQVLRKLCDDGALAVGVDSIPSYADENAIRDFASVAVEYRDKLALIAYLDPDVGLTAPPDMMVAPLGVDHLGLANLSLDQDGVCRSQNLAPIAFSALGLESWPFFDAVLIHIVDPQCTLPDRLLVNSSGRKFASLSFEEVLNSDLHGRFAGKIVLIGSRTRVDGDIVLTPGHSGFGVDFHAEILNTLLTGKSLIELPTSAALALLITGNALFGAMSWRGRSSLLGLVIAEISWIGLALVLLEFGWIVPQVAGLLSFLSTWSLISFFRFRQGQKLMTTLEGYVAPEILREMLTDPGKWNESLTQRREVTVLFSDINDFSTVSEELSAETVAGRLNQHYREMARIIFQHEGTIIRFVGDQFMVLFGAPKPHPQPELAAVQTALAMHGRLQQLAELGQPGFFKIKVGIHRGPMLLAVLGDDLKREYTAIGDDANVAARIQDLCKQAGEPTLVSQDIYERVQPLGLVDFLDKGLWSVKGRHHQVHIYAPRSTVETLVDP